MYDEKTSKLNAEKQAENLRRLEIEQFKRTLQSLGVDFSKIK